MERGPSRLGSSLQLKETIEVRFEKASESEKKPEPEKKIELEKRCDEVRFRKTASGETVRVCRRDAADGKTCDYQNNKILVTANVGYQQGSGAPPMIPKYVCSKAQEIYAQNKPESSGAK